jgi:hypothetical protein
VGTGRTCEGQEELSFVGCFKNVLIDFFIKNV